VPFLYAYRLVLSGLRIPAGHPQFSARPVRGGSGVQCSDFSGRIADPVSLYPPVAEPLPGMETYRHSVYEKHPVGDPGGGVGFLDCQKHPGGTFFMVVAGVKAEGNF